MTSGKRISFRNTLYVAINRAFADELNLVAGDVFEFGWYVTNESKRQRIDSNATVLSVVSNQGQGASAGTQSPALFTDLQTAQSLQRLEGRVNTIYYAVDDSHDDASHIAPIIEDLELLLDDSILAGDVGLELDTDSNSNSLTLSSTTGLGRLNGELVRG